jgi:hypothetical protein
VDMRQYDKAFMLFGSSCRLLAGKVGKDYKTVLQDLWDWSKRQIEELNGTAPDVPEFTPPTTTSTPMTSPSASTGNPGIEPKVPEKPVNLTASEVLISDVQQERFVAHAKKNGWSEEALSRFLDAQGIRGVPNIPLSKGKMLWEAVKDPIVVSKY